MSNPSVPVSEPARPPEAVPPGGDGRVALVSGAARGIGAATAAALAEAGWSLSLGMRRPALPAWADPARVQVVAYDAEDPEAGDRWAAAALDQFGRIDAVVANAGLIYRKTGIEVSDGEFAEMMRVHVDAPRRLARACWPALVASGSGRIVILASLSGKRVKSPASGSYAVTKFAAIGLAHALRRTGFDLGIRVTAVCPGFVATDMSATVAGHDPAAFTRPEDVAASIVHIVGLPNRASVSELWMNGLADDSY
jgi:NAD(P)-dependent dehydrogenase (short-subunit alcohol dehydrogenase family)